MRRVQLTGAPSASQASQKTQDERDRRGTRNAQDEHTKIIAALAALSLLLALLGGCDGNTADSGSAENSATASVQASPASASAAQSDSTTAALPATTAGIDVDENINQETIDNYLDREDVAYREVRKLYDPANFGEDTQSNLTATLRGFKVTPVVYLANVPLPLPGLYTGPCLYRVEWDDEGRIVSATENYVESEVIISDLFPKNKAIFLQCDAGVYAGFAKELLLCLGYDEDKIYNVGGNWSYSGSNAINLGINVEGKAGKRSPIASWKADCAYIDFSMLHPK
jgi:rhodanese-related sulfurtransferase